MQIQRRMHTQRVKSGKQYAGLTHGNKILSNALPSCTNANNSAQHTVRRAKKLGKKYSQEGCEGGVGLERLGKGLSSLITKAVVLETAREGR